MNCINLKIRTKQYKRYIYCSFLKKEIEYCECINCDNKTYKKANTIKGKKHKRTKFTDIDKKTKMEVWQRDKGKCIFCDCKVEWNFANAHYIPRSHGGLGIEENIFTACAKCHNEQDNGLNSKEYTEKAKYYLKSKYKNWNEQNLIYKK